MNPHVRNRLVLTALGIAVLAVLAWLVMSQGPLAPVKVTVAKVERGTLTATTFGIGTVEARRTYALGPTVASRVQRVLVDHGDKVAAGQLVAELDPVDLDDRIASGAAGVERAASAIKASAAQLAEAQSRAQVASANVRRYEDLRRQGFVSQEAVDTRRHDATAAQAAVDAATAQLAAAHRDHERAQSDVAGTAKLRAQQRLASPVAGVVTARLVEPGTTVVAGQAVVQVIDPASLWVRVRVDQGQAGAIRVGQRADIVLRSDPKTVHRGEVQRVDLTSDPVTEERIVNVAFASQPPGMSMGELVEVTIRVAELRDVRSIPAAAVRRVDRQEGVWRLIDGRLAFHPVKIGTTTSDGRTTVESGLDEGETVVVHSEQALQAETRVKVVPALVRSGP